MLFKYSLALILLVGAALPTAAKPFHHPFGEWREYNQDWLAACPDKIDEKSTDYYGFSCFASTGSQELNSTKLPAYKITLLRNRLTGEIDISFIVAADGLDSDLSRPLTLTFGGDQPQSFNFSEDLQTRYNTINQYYVAAPMRRDELLEALKSRNSVTAVFPVTLTNGKTETREVRFSLRGVNASLDFMSTYARKVAQY
jgi:hypothetical protein